MRNQGVSAGCFLLAGSISSFYLGNVAALRLIGVLALWFGSWVFLRHGGRKITAAGVYSLALAVFVGFSALWLSQHAGRATPAVLNAARWSFMAHLSMYWIFWRGSDAAARRITLDTPTPEQQRFALTAGVALLVMGIGVDQSGIDFGPLGAGAAYAGALLAAISLLLTRRRSILRWREIAAGGLAGTYIVSVFDGGGRLIVATLLLSLPIASSWSKRQRYTKALVVGSVIPALVIFGTMRSQSAAAVGFEASDSGLGSVVGPLEVFGQLTERSESPAHGRTFLVAFVAHIPRQIWPDKPIGFGAELTQELRPDLVRSNHSMAATDAGEWFYNFHWAGLAGYIVVVGAGIRWVDRRFVPGRLRAVGRTRRGLLTSAVAVAAVAGMGDLAWGGPFTYSTRAVTRIILLGMAAWVLTRPAHRSPEHAAVAVWRR